MLQPVFESDIANMIANPLSLGQSMIQVWPQLVIIVALAIICFSLSYVMFMRQEIRST
jgi:ABC-2 type transport system permease protein